MIVLLSCSISLSGNNPILPTGEVVTTNDSVMISYDDLRIVNSKLIELNYQKEINTNLRTIIANDSIIIKKHIELNDKVNKDYKNTLHQRNIFIGTTIVAVIVSLLFLIK